MTLLLEAALKGSAVLLVALVAAALLRRQSSAARHWLLAAAIVSAGAVPLALRVAPSWSLARPSSHAPARADAAVDVAFDLPAVPAPAAVVVSRPPLGPMAWVTVAWLAGVVVSLALLFAGLLRLRVMRRAAEPFDDDRWQRALAQTAAEIGLSRPVRILCGPGRVQVATWGTRHPVLLVPRGAREWDDERVAVVLRHELAHVVRYDWAIQLVVALARATYWFDPVMWLACSTLRRESEQACDDVVLGAGIAPAVYATHLVDLARAAAARSAWVPAQAIVRPSQLQRRVRAMLHADVNRQPVTRTGRIAPIAVMLFVTLAIAGFGRADQSGTVFSGTVIDPMGRGMPGATVSLIDQQSRATHEVVTDQSGHFTFVPLPAGDYKLLARKAGFQVVAETVTLTGAASTRMLAMALGTVEESIRVTDVPAPSKPSTMTTEQRRAKARASRANDPCATSPDGGCLLPPVKLYDVRPVYPESLKGTAIADPVVLRATIATDGAVKDITLVSSPNPELTAAAMDAVRQWEFAPTQLAGVPVETSMRVTVKFEKQ